MVSHWGLDRFVRYGDTASKPGRLQAIIEPVDKILGWHLTGDETRALVIADTETTRSSPRRWPGALPRSTSSRP